MEGPISHDDLVRRLRSDELEAKAKHDAASLKIEHIDLRKYAVFGEALTYIAKKDAEALKLVPFRHDLSSLYVGITTLTTKVEDFLKDLAKKSKLTVVPYLISAEGLANVLAQYDTTRMQQLAYAATIPKREGAARQVELKRIDVADFEAFNALLLKGSTEEQLNNLLSGALSFGGSDIHIEPSATQTRVRFRIDGILHEAANLPLKISDALLIRIKFFSKLKLNVAEPQDGRIESIFENTKIDFRVSSIPTIYGENMTIRVLKTSAQSLNLQDLGLSDYDMTTLNGMVTHPRGMILVTGPTGNGKTTTIFAILAQLNNPSIKIATLEDPVEYTLPGAVQSQVNEEVGFTFANGIRAILRQNPDIILIGEIRDPASAETAFRAALTGHIALSTFHAGEAVGVIPSMVEMGVRPYLAGSALSLVVAQRLVRKICNVCKAKAEVSSAIEKSIRAKLAILPKELRPGDLGKLAFYHGKGCETCHGLGYQGQIGIFELMRMTPEIISASLEDKTLKEIQGIAISQGMIPMEIDGYLKALRGMTSIEEVIRTVGAEVE